MLIYWFLFFIPLIAALSPVRLTKDARIFMLILVGLVFIFLIGFRHQVGGDWLSYLRSYNAINNTSFYEALLHSDLGYVVLNKASGLLDGGIYLVNIVAAFIFTAGVFAFSYRQPQTWLALLVAVPYLIIVVGMGYTRQSIAIGFSFFALNAITDRKFFAFIFWVMIAVLFHKTAIILLPLLIVLSKSKFYALLSLVFIVMSAFILFFILPEGFLDLIKYYITDQYMESSGALLRVIMNAIPALIMLFFGHHLTSMYEELILWKLFSIVALLFLPLVFFASTAVDRIALYIIPLQMFVFSRVYIAVNFDIAKAAVVVFIISYYAIIQIIWLNYAAYSRYWVPYNSIIFY